MMLETSLIFFLICTGIASIVIAIAVMIGVTRYKGTFVQGKKIPVMSTSDDQFVDESEASLHKRLSKFQHTQFGKRLIQQQNRK